MRVPPAPPTPVQPKPSIRARFTASNFGRVLRHADFRLLWIGAFVSFTGSWVQNVAQGYTVYELTHDESKLAFVSFANSLPVFVLGLAAGSLADVMEKKKVLIAAQLAFSAGSAFLAAAIYFGFAQYWHFPLVAFLLGLVACIEMPTRQSIVSKVVPVEDLPAAVPIQAMTFNIARIVGPAIGGLLLARFSAAACYAVNSLTFLVLIRNVLAMKTDLRPTAHRRQPLRDLVSEGARYTWRDNRLRTLLILESITAAAGIAYIPMLPAYVREQLNMSAELSKVVLGNCYTAIGIGALIGLVSIIQLSEPRYRAFMIRSSMWILAASLVVLSFARTPLLAYMALPFAGMATIVQFNTTNALFQILSPERLRGRVLAMHIWALNGLSPFGVMLFGAIAARTDVDTAMKMGGVLMMIAAVFATFFASGLNGLSEQEPEAAVA